jgi:hypothetical protein
MHEHQSCERQRDDVKRKSEYRCRTATQSTAASASHCSVHAMRQTKPRTRSISITKRNVCVCVCVCVLAYRCAQASSSLHVRQVGRQHTPLPAMPFGMRDQGPLIDNILAGANTSEPHGELAASSCVIERKDEAQSSPCLSMQTQIHSLTNKTKAINVRRPSRSPCARRRAAAPPPPRRPA